LYDQCPNCRYDLAGLNRDVVVQCPECGAGITLGDIARAFRKRVRRLWRFFFLMPIITMPGCVVFFIGQPIACLVLATILAHRALRLEDRINNRSEMPGSTLAMAMLAGGLWTVIGTGIVVTSILGIVQVLSFLTS
jgi:hypothetical protein